MEVVLKRRVAEAQLGVGDEERASAAMQRYRCAVCGPRDLVVRLDDGEGCCGGGRGSRSGSGMSWGVRSGITVRRVGRLLLARSNIAALHQLTR